MIGARIGSWIIDKEIGRGGMGTVYLAREDTPPAAGPRLAAVKVLAPELAAEPGFQQRFQREIDILRQLDHPNIVRFHEAGSLEGKPCYVMEHVAGPTYDDLLARRGKLPWQDVLDLALQVAPALKHAHDRGIIHRDIKPANLMRCEAPDQPSIVKLTDFGIASLFASTHLTVTGGIIGTAEFLSPEQAAGKPASRRSDLYSLGVVLYTLLTGRTPFEGGVIDLLHKHRYAQFDRPIRIVPDLPHDFDNVVCQLLEKDPADRPPDGGVLYRRLDSLRRKLARKAATAPTPVGAATAEGGVASVEGKGRTGPATLMSRLVRAELDRQNRGGPVQRFFNQPLVLVMLFALTIGGIVWGFWPPGEETLFARGAALMDSDDPDDWYEGWERYLQPLNSRYPNHKFRKQVEQYHRRYDAYREALNAQRAAKHAGPMSEAQHFYQKGLRLRQRGDEQGARHLWKLVKEGFVEVPSQEPWVRKAEQELESKDLPPRNLGPVREAIEQARTLADEGRPQDAQKILEALRQLYKDDPEVAAEIPVLKDPMP